MKMGSSAQSTMEPNKESAKTTPDLDQIYRDCFASVHRLLRRLGAAERDLEDLVHDVFVVAHRRLADFDTTRPIRPWIYGIATRVAIAYSRRAYQQRVDIRPDVEQQVVDHASALRVERQQLAIRLLSAIPIDQRTVFVLHELEGYSVKEVAAITDTPVNTAFSRLRLAREKFDALAEEARRRGAQ